MSFPLPVFHNHSRHQLCILHTDLPLDVLAFAGAEGLSQTFRYTIEFTSRLPDIDPEQILLKPASFSLRAPAWQYTEVSYLDLKPLPMAPLRTLYGVITEFKRLSGSRDESRYEVTLEPRLALLERGKQCRLYQHQSVPEIVESILRSRHGFRGEDFYFDVLREYPRRLQVMQYDESDLAFITRLLADIGLWFRFTHDDRLQIEVVEFHDDQRRYQFGIELPLTPPSGLTNTGADHVWDLQTQHRVVEKHMNIRAYDPQQARAWMQGEVDQTLGSSITYGEAYHYAEPYTVLGDRYDQDEHLQSESGFFYARLRHERYLNGRVGISGASTSATLVPGQVLKVKGAPSVFDDGVVITSLQTRAARDSSFVVAFQGMPFYERICFRPPALPKPVMAGTLPARITSPVANNIYGELNPDGHYTVQFLFDRDTWQLGRESKLLRLARPYAGDTYGLHFPLVTGTEVAIAFEQGDPDRPYIAHALHDSEHPDPVAMRNDRRNVLRTPANNKLRMEDHRGQEHIKLSTEHSGKSQLNLGHLVDAERFRRGEGFELRTDGWGAIRGGRGLYITADEQPLAGGGQLDMGVAIAELQSALDLARSLSQGATSALARPADAPSQTRLVEALGDLKQPGILLHAPAGIGLTSPEAICLASGTESIAVTAAHNTDLVAGQHITATAEGGISMLAMTEGLQLKASHGKVELHAQDDILHALARADVKIESTAGRVEITASRELLLNCGGAYIRIKDGDIEIGAPGNIFLKATHAQKLGSASLSTPATPLPEGYSGGYTVRDADQTPKPYARYQVKTPQGGTFTGLTDKHGQTMSVHTPLPGGLEVSYPDPVAPFDERLRLVGEEGRPACHLKYAAHFADGGVLEGMTDDQGCTERLVTQEALQVIAITLTAGAAVPATCCSADGHEEPLRIDLEAQRIFTNDTLIGSSTLDIRLPPGGKRLLTSGEIAMARTVFKNAVDYSKVHVYHKGWWLFFGMQDTAVTPNGNMYFPERTGYYRDDFSSTVDSEDKALFMHEMTHVWQYQLGYSVKWHGLTVTSQGARAYRYSLHAMGQLCDYNMEQQGEIVSDYYMICVIRDSAGVWNKSNQGNDAELLASTVRPLLEDPFDKSNLPRGKES